jgi:hypothetical protein
MTNKTCYAFEWYTNSDAAGESVVSTRFTIFFDCSFFQLLEYFLKRHLHKGSTNPDLANINRKSNRFDHPVVMAVQDQKRQ